MSEFSRRDAFRLNLILLACEALVFLLLGIGLYIAGSIFGALIGGVVSPLDHRAPHDVSHSLAVFAALPALYLAVVHAVISSALVRWLNTRLAVTLGNLGSLFVLSPFVLWVFATLHRMVK